MLTWDQCDLNWNMWLNGFLKKSCACKSLQKLKSFREREGWVRRVLLWTGIVPLTLFTEMTEKRMNFVADGMGNGIWGSKVISRKQSERWRPHGMATPCVEARDRKWNREEGRQMSVRLTCRISDHSSENPLKTHLRVISAWREWAINESISSYLRHGVYLCAPNGAPQPLTFTITREAPELNARVLNTGV